MEVQWSAVPAEVSITPGGTGLGPFPKSESLSLSTSFILPLPQLFLFLHPRNTPLHAFEPDPLPPPQLWSVPQFILYPHEHLGPRPASTPSLEQKPRGPHHSSLASAEVNFPV